MAVRSREDRMKSPRAVLLDTSAWIAFLGSTEHDDLKAATQQALRAERVWSCPVVVAELLVGARDRAALTKLRNLLGALPRVDIDENLWMQAAELGFVLRRKGVTAPLPDLLIAAACRLHSLEVWHLDEHYEQICAVTELRTRSFLG